MPDLFLIRFGETPGSPEMPEPALVGHAAAWAAERGYWDVATCLMELAHALAELDKPTPIELPQPWSAELAHALAELDKPTPIELPQPWSAVVADDKAWTPDERYVTELPHEPQPTCSHGYATRDGVHLATGGRCDPPRWCNAPEELGGQQTCALGTPCAAGACEIGERIPFGALGPADRP